MRTRALQTLSVLEKKREGGQWCGIANKSYATATDAYSMKESLRWLQFGLCLYLNYHRCTDRSDAVPWRILRHSALLDS